MAKRVEVSPKDAIVSQAYMLEALIRLLERKNIFSREEVLKEIKAVQAEAENPQN